MPIYSAETVLRLTGLIYDAALDRERWVLFLDALGGAIDGHTLHLATIDTSSGVSISVTAKADPVFLQDYQAYYATMDPWLLAAKRAGLLRPGATDVGERYVPPSALMKTEFYNDLARRHDIIGGISAFFGVDETITALSVSQRRFSQFGDAELGLIHQLLPHVRRALTVHQRIGAAETMTAAAASALDRMPHAVFFLSRTGRLLLANGAGGDLLRRRDGFAADNGELRAGTPSQTATLHTAIAAALQATGRIVDGNRQVTMLARGVGRRPLAVVAIPVTPVGARHVPDGAAVALIITDPEQIRPPQLETIRSMFRLTPGEARLVHSLAEGLTLKESAERLGINLETARKRLKVIFQKTDVHRQADLVRVVLLAAPPADRG